MNGEEQNKKRKRHDTANAKRANKGAGGGGGRGHARRSAGGPIVFFFPGTSRALHFFFPTQILEGAGGPHGSGTQRELFCDSITSSHLHRISPASTLFPGGSIVFLFLSLLAQGVSMYFSLGFVAVDANFYTCRLWVLFRPAISSRHGPFCLPNHLVFSVLFSAARQSLCGPTLAFQR